MSQTVYNEDLDIAFPGMLATTSQVDVLSRASEESAAFSYGVMVRQGTADDQALLPSAATQNALGVAMHSHATEIVNDLNQVQPNREFNILHEGPIYVLPEDAVTPASPVFTRITAEAPPLDKLGAFRSDNSGGNATAVTGARWLTSGNATTPAILEVDRSVSY